ncbi:insulinase family protein [soil metagenome]
MQRLRLLLLVVVCAACGLLRGPSGPSPRTPLPADTALHAGTLANGLRYYVRANREPRARAELRLVVDAGSVLEDPDQLGVAHFVEHMAFNGTRRFPRHELVDYLEGIGMRFGPDINAYTGFDETVYQLSVPTDSAGMLARGFDILEDWASGIAFDSADVEQERGVVIEEWRLGLGAGSRIRDRQLPVLYGGSRYAERLPIGTRASLDTVSAATLRRFYRDWYRPDLMAIVAVGDFDVARVEQMIRARFDSLSGPAEPRPRPAFPVPSYDRTSVSVVTDREVTASRFTLYLKRPARAGGTYGASRRGLVESLAGAMLMERLYERTQEPGAELLDVGSYTGRLLRPLEGTVLSGSAREGEEGEAVAMLLRELRRAAQHGFTAAELERAQAETLRRAEQRHAERERATSVGYAADYAGAFLYGDVPTAEDTDYELLRGYLPGVRLRDVDAVARGWAAQRDRTLLVTATAKPGEPPPSEAVLAAIVAQASAETTFPYREDVHDAPLLDPLPQPGRVVAETGYPEVGVTEWRLSNGARVLLKPTDFGDDQILLAGRSPGGSSLVPDSLFLAARFATAAVQTAGVGRWDLVALGKRLAGKGASVGVSLDDDEEAVSGSARPRDAETLFQLVYLYFTAPRRDTSAWNAYRSRARERLRNRDASPEAAFADTLQLALTQGHPRARPISAATFDSLDLDRSLEVYRERFADAGDFTFYLVGSFSPDSLRSLVERYLASLPAEGGGEHARDLGIRPPPDVVSRTVRRGSEPKAATRIVFSGEMDFGRSEVNALYALQETLELRLRETLREELGGTYGAGVGAVALRDPHPHYRVAIGFGTSPERLDELTRTVFAEIARLREEGPRPGDLAKVREAVRRQQEIDLREDGFWLRQLIRYDRYGWDLREIPAGAERLRRIDADAVRRAAVRYLDPDRYVQVSLLPDTAAGSKATPAPD